MMVRYKQKIKKMTKKNERFYENDEIVGLFGCRRTIKPNDFMTFSCEVNGNWEAVLSVAMCFIYYYMYLRPL